VELDASRLDFFAEDPRERRRPAEERRGVQSPGDEQVLEDRAQRELDGLPSALDPD
jgi:hypothetical protein